MLKNVLAVAAVSMVALSPAAQAAGPYTYRNVSAGLCLDVYNGRAVPGAPVQIYRCTGGAPQKWYRMDTDDGSVFETALNRRLCVDAHPGPGQQLVLEGCDRGDPNQRWYRTPLSDGAVAYRSVRWSGQCLDAENGTGPKAIMYDCHYGPEQRWR